MHRTPGRTAPTTTLLAALVALLVATPASAAVVVPVDVTFLETLPATTGVVDAGGIAGCHAPTTTTTGVSVAVHGTTTDVWGTKLLTCGDGSTLELGFKLAIEGCEDVGAGGWYVAGATGVFAGASGSGDLTASYPGGSACGAEKVLDHYVGVLVVP